MSSTGDNAEVTIQQTEPGHPSSGSEYEDEAKGQSHDEDYEASEESEREGRFHGPDSSWRFYTKEERAIATSLDQAENDDLSIHLYNAHAWKQRLRHANRIEFSQPWYCKRRWVQLEDNGKMPFLPPAAWTAWPIRPEDVPRSREQWGIPVVAPEDDVGTFAKREPWRPSLHLQEELKAAFLRRAKECFHERDRALTDKKEIHAEEISSSKSMSMRTGSAETQSSDSRQRLKLESGDEDAGIESVSEHESVHEEEFNASILLDDDLAGSILQPTIRHLTAEVDDLLIGLHKNRLGHRQERARSRGRSTDSPLRSKSRERARSVTSVPSKRKRAASDLKLQDGELQPVPASEDSEFNEETRTGRGIKRGGRKHLLGTRDWSEVLGVAALVGWDQDVLDRAARRCAATFGESMTMRTMPETSFGACRDEVVEYVPQMIPKIDSASEDGFESQEESEGGHELTCPVPSCPRHNEPYETRWRLREHLKKKHKLSKAEVDRMVPRAQEPSEELKSISSDEQLSQQEGVHSEAKKAEGFGGTDAVRPDGFLQPIDVRLYRSKDKHQRRRSSSGRKQRDAAAAS